MKKDKKYDKGQKRTKKDERGLSNMWGTMHGE